MLSHYKFHNRMMLATIGEGLLNIGTIEYKLSCGIPRLQSYFGMSVGVCYRKPNIPSLDLQKEPCLKLRDWVRELVDEDFSTYAKLNRSQGEMRRSMG